jgi:GAF domain-containing protein
MTMADLDDPVRLAQFKAAITRLDSDGVLEECVREAAARAEAPIALITFVMSKVQLFRAAVGLPPELEATRATSRCDSFCQFVVKEEGPFIVSDAKNDARVPQTMVVTYGIAAYLGVPIYAGGQVLGSLCVADGQKRSWKPELVDELGALAARVSKRLDALNAGDASHQTRSGQDVNQLAAEVSVLAQVIQRSLVEVGPMVRLAKGMSQGISPDALARAAGVLTEASNFYDDMMSAVNDLSSSASSLERAVPARTN